MLGTLKGIVVRAVRRQIDEKLRDAFGGHLKMARTFLPDSRFVAAAERLTDADDPIALGLCTLAAAIEVDLIHIGHLDTVVAKVRELVAAGPIGPEALAERLRQCADQVNRARP